jgi:hypothetical protein
MHLLMSELDSQILVATVQVRGQRRGREWPGSWAVSPTLGLWRAFEHNQRIGEAVELKDNAAAATGRGEIKLWPLGPTKVLAW